MPAPPDLSSLTLRALDETVAAAAARGPDAVDAAIAGKQVGKRYRLERVLGSGAFGAVFRAIDELSGDPVAVKLVRGLDDDTLSTVRRETATLRLLRLPGVVSLLDEGTDDDRHFIVTELVTGAHFPGVQGPSSWDAIREPTLGLLEALARVHAAGVVHRDLKPANVLVGDDGNVTLIDFGVATAPEYTGTGLAVRGTAGTPMYIAPEQVRGAPATERTDLYCLGVMLFEALSGELPHAQPDARTLMRAKLNVSAPGLASVAPDVPAAVCDVVDALLQARSSRRPASAWQVLHALQGLQVDDPVSETIAGQGPGPLSIADLATLVAGYEAFLRIPSDTATELHLRTDGMPDAVIDRLRSWQRARLARVNEGRLHIDRPAIDRLRAGLGVVPDRPPSDAVRAELTDDDRELLCWYETAWPNATEQAIEDATGWERGRIMAARHRLVAHGLLRVAPDGRWMPRGGWLLHEHWDGAQARVAHTAIASALAAGTPGRLLHLLRAGMTDDVMAETLAVHESHLASGERNLAIEVLREGLTFARAARLDEAPLLEAAVAVACLHAEPAVVDRVMHTVHTSAISSTSIEVLLDLCRAMLLSRGGDHDRAVELVGSMGPLANPYLERWRLVVYADEARRRGPAGFRARYEELRAAYVEPHPRVASMFDIWHTRVLYDEHRFAEAARRSLELLARSDSRIERMGRLHSVAIALMEQGELERAREVARQAADLAAESRDAYLEVLCSSVELSAAYKLRQPAAWSQEELAAALDVAEPGGTMGGLLACAGQAARTGDIERARSIARVICSRAHMLNRSSAAVFARVLGAYSDVSGSEAVDVAEVLEVAARLEIPGVDAQAAHMVRAVRPQWADRAEAIIRAAIKRLGDPPGAQRRELFSVADMLAHTDIALRARERWLAGLGDDDLSA